MHYSFGLRSSKTTNIRYSYLAIINDKSNSCELKPANLTLKIYSIIRTYKKT